MTNFKKELLAVGYTGGTELFYREVDQLFVTHFDSFQTDEQLKRQPREAIRFCEMVRDHFENREMPDELILGALENHRKHQRRSHQTA